MDEAYLEHVSRFLSLVLRHKPGAIGIALDEHGWAEVPALIAGMRTQKPGFDLAMLEEIVRTDAKQRYSFNGDHTRIRANQGHSVPVDVELKEARPPEILYHGTGEKNVSSIAARGLLPQSRLYVHLSKDIATAEKVGRRHGSPVVFRVLAGQMREAGARFYLSENGVWLVKAVPPEYLRLDE